MTGPAQPGGVAAQSAPDPSWPQDAVEVGVVVGPWGLKGMLRVVPLARDPQALLASKRWYVQPPARIQPGPVTAFPALVQVTSVKEHGDALVASVKECPDRNAAEAMKGARLFVPRSSFPSAAEGEFYWVDLIGLSVSNRQGENLGIVEDLLDTGAHSVLRVVEPTLTDAVAATERLIPFVAAYIDDVDLVSRRITVDWGLDY